MSYNTAPAIHSVAPFKSSVMKNNYSFIQYSETMKIPDGIYNARYNAEPTVIRIKGGKPVYVSHIGFLQDGEPRSSSIFLPQGILLSSVELLLPAQEI